MKCSKCGNEFEGNFCPNCGLKIATVKDLETQKKATKGCLLLLSPIILLIVCGIFFSIFPSKEAQERNIKSSVIVIAQEEVKGRLKSPSTAEFPWDPDNYIIKQNGNEYTVYSYVDAQNSFGAKIRNKYVAMFYYYPDTKNHEVESIKLYNN